MKYLLIILLIVGCTSNDNVHALDIRPKAYSIIVEGTATYDTIPKKDSVAKYLGWDLPIDSSYAITNGTGITAGYWPKAQYDTVDVICLVSDSVFKKYVDGLLTEVYQLRAKAVRECNEWRVINGNGEIEWKCYWDIIKHLGIPSRYIIWQTKILK